MLTELPHEPVTAEGLPGLEFFLFGDREGLRLIAQTLEGENAHLLSLSRWGKIVRGINIRPDFPILGGSDTNASIPICFPGEEMGGQRDQRRQVATTTSLPFLGSEWFLRQEDNSITIYAKQTDEDGDLCYRHYGIINPDSFYRWQVGRREDRIPGIRYNNHANLIKLENVPELEKLKLENTTLRAEIKALRAKLPPVKEPEPESKPTTDSSANEGTRAPESSITFSTTTMGLDQARAAIFRPWHHDLVQNIERHTQDAAYREILGINPNPFAPTPPAEDFENIEADDEDTGEDEDNNNDEGIPDGDDDEVAF